MYLLLQVILNREYKLWRQQDYAFMYSIKDPQIKELRVGLIFY